jgi:hypothetical protein
LLVGLVGLAGIGCGNGSGGSPGQTSDRGSGGVSASGGKNGSGAAKGSGGATGGQSSGGNAGAGAGGTWRKRVGQRTRWFDQDGRWLEPAAGGQGAGGWRGQRGDGSKGSGRIGGLGRCSNGRQRRRRWPSATGGAPATGGPGAGGQNAGGSTGTGGAATGGNTSGAGGKATGGSTGNTAAARAGGASGKRRQGNGRDVGRGGQRCTGGASGTGGKGGTTGAPDASTSGYHPCPTDGTACKIMPFGDSITDGYNADTPGGYRVELFRRAHSAGKNITFVGSGWNGPDTVDGAPFPHNHEGHSGWTIAPEEQQKRHLDAGGDRDADLRAGRP